MPLQRCCGSTGSAGFAAALQHLKRPCAWLSHASMPLPTPPTSYPPPFPFPPISVNLCRMKVGLDEMYKGSVRKLQMTRSVKCDKCSGSGSKSGKRYTCEVRGSTRCAAPRCGKQHSGGGTVGRPVPAWEQFGRQRSVIERLAEPQPHAMIGIRPLPHQPRFAPCATLCRPATAAALR